MSALAVLISLVGAPARSDICDQVFSGPQVAKLEVAALIAEKHSLVDPTTAALRAILDTDISKKISEYEEAFGVPLSSEELSSLVEQLNLVDQAKMKESLTREIKIRVQEESKVLVYSEVMIERLGELDSLRAQEINTRGGLQWSVDERYLLLRPKDNSSKPVILDLKNRSKLPITASDGWLSVRGNFYAAIDNGFTTVLDLDTSTRYGPFAGRPSLNHPFTDQHLVLVDGEDRITILDYKNNRPFEIAKTKTATLNITPDYRRAVLAKELNAPFEVWDIDTCAQVQIFEGKDPPMSLWRNPPQILTRNRNKKQISIVRVSDLKHFAVPKMENMTGPKISADGQKVILGGLTRDSYILNIVTGELISFKGYKHNLGDRDHYRHWVVMQPTQVDKKTIVVNLDTMDQSEYDWPITDVSEDGQWLSSRVKQPPPDQGLYRWFHVGTQTTVFRPLKQVYKPVPKSKWMLIEHESNALLSQAGLDPIQIGFHGVATSPSGEYVVTYADLDKSMIKVLKLKSR